MRFFPKRLNRFGTILMIAVSALLLAGCSVPDTPMSTFAAQGYESAQIYSLFKPLFWMAIAVFILVEGILLIAVFRFRRKPGDGIPVQLHGNQTIELGWTVAPALIVLFIAVLSFHTQALLSRPAKDPVKITVIGHQWWWEFQYPDLGIITANEVHLPLDRDVQFTLRSADVIHSFHLPRLVGTQDMIPGHETHLLVHPQIVGTGLIHGHCKEFCGGTHSMMSMNAAVQPTAEFDAWVKQQQQQAALPAGITQAAPAASAAAGGANAATSVAGSGGAVGATAEANATGFAATGPDIAATTAAKVGPTANSAATVAPQAQATSLEGRGYQLFTTKGCIGCHAISGYPNAVAKVGPNLTHVGSRQYIVAAWLQNTPDNLKTWLRDPAAVKPENVMSTVIKAGTLKEDEINALTAYLESLK